MSPSGLNIVLLLRIELYNISYLDKLTSTAQTSIRMFNGNRKQLRTFSMIFSIALDPILIVIVMLKGDGVPLKLY